MDAVEIGRLLSEQKADMQHGDFGPWIKANASFGMKSAEKYMTIHTHSDKIVSSANLSLAYAKAVAIEDQQRREHKEQVKSVVDNHREAGTRPLKKDNREVYDEYRKQDDEKAYVERREEAFATEPAAPGPTTADIEEVLEQSRRVVEEQKRHAHLNLSSYADTATQAGMFSAIEAYINSFDDVSRQLEATHNLIKKLKLIASDLQVSSIVQVSSIEGEEG